MNKNYGETFTFNINEPITFPDFVITYLGDEDRPVPQYTSAGKFVYQKYLIKPVDGEEFIRKWTSGTGLIHPLFFSVTGKEFGFMPNKKETKIVVITPENKMDFIIGKEI